VGGDRAARPVSPAGVATPLYRGQAIWQARQEAFAACRTALLLSVPPRRPSHSPPTEAPSGKRTTAHRPPTLPAGAPPQHRSPQCAQHTFLFRSGQKSVLSPNKSHLPRFQR
jgi:hypothetical protein